MRRRPERTSASSQALSDHAGRYSDRVSSDTTAGTQSDGPARAQSGARRRLSFASAAACPPTARHARARRLASLRRAPSQQRRSSRLSRRGLRRARVHKVGRLEYFLTRPLLSRAGAAQRAPSGAPGGGGNGVGDRCRGAPCCGCGSARCAPAASRRGWLCRGRRAGGAPLCPARRAAPPWRPARPVRGRKMRPGRRARRAARGAAGRCAKQTSSRGTYVQARLRAGLPHTRAPDHARHARCGRGVVASCEGCLVRDGRAGGRRGRAGRRLLFCSRRI